MRIISFCGPKGSGKDTAAAYLLARNSLENLNLFQRVNFADPLKASTTLIFGYSQLEMSDALLKEKAVDRWPYKSPRETLQNFAHTMRTMYQPDIWVKAWERNIQLQPAITAACIVCTDLRHMEELDKLQELKATIFYIDNPKVEQLRQKGIDRGDPRWTDPSEAMAPLLRQVANQVVDNSGSLDQLQSNVFNAVTQELGDFHLWSQKV